MILFLSALNLGPRWHTFFLKGCNEDTSTFLLISRHFTHFENNINKSQTPGGIFNYLILLDIMMIFNISEYDLSSMRMGKWQLYTDQNYQYESQHIIYPSPKYIKQLNVKQELLFDIFCELLSILHKYITTLKAIWKSKLVYF